VGAINVLVMDEVESLGYWIGREFWGRGIASRAVALMCKEVTMRPLFATTAEWNHASLRVLMKHGFVEESREWTVETERSVARVTVKLKLG
jgi:RimJ/RimL family protein N-acetyltransferase